MSELLETQTFFVLSLLALSYSKLLVHSFIHRQAICLCQEQGQTENKIARFFPVIR